MAGGSTVPAMMLHRSSLSSLPAEAGRIGPDHPAPGPVLADIGLLLACHLAVALAICLVLDLWG